MTDACVSIICLTLLILTVHDIETADWASGREICSVRQTRSPLFAHQALIGAYSFLYCLFMKSSQVLSNIVFCNFRYSNSWNEQLLLVSASSNVYLLKAFSENVTSKLPNDDFSNDNSFKRSTAIFSGCVAIGLSLYFLNGRKPLSLLNLYCIVFYIIFLAINTVFVKSCRMSQLLRYEQL